MSMSRKKTAFVLFGVVLGLSQSVVAAHIASATGWVAGQQNVDASNLPVSSIYEIINNTLSWLLAVLGFIAVMGFVISGIQYLLAAGDEGMIDRAKNAMKYSIIGVIVALGGYVVIFAVNNWLNAGTRF